MSPSSRAMASRAFPQTPTVFDTTRHVERGGFHAEQPVPRTASARRPGTRAASFPTPITSRPVAIGSRVPAWPTFFTPRPADLGHRVVRGDGACRSAAGRQGIRPLGCQCRPAAGWHPSPPAPCTPRPDGGRRRRRQPTRWPRRTLPRSKRLSEPTVALLLGHAGHVGLPGRADYASIRSSRSDRVTPARARSS